MAVNKIQTRKGSEVNVLMDLTSDTVTPEGLLEGLTAHGADGKPITGTLGTATEEKAGLVKLYSEVGANTDGAVAQNAVTDLLSGRKPVLASDTSESYTKETPYPYAVVNSIGGKCEVVDDGIAFAEVEQVVTDKGIYPIPEAIRQLDGYGVGMLDGSACNTVDCKNKTYTQNCYVDGLEVKMLEKPIITDLSNILSSDFLIECEAGGTMTFENSAGLAVPSDIEFVTESNYTKRLVEKYAKGGGGITVIDGTDSVIIKAEQETADV